MAGEAANGARLAAVLPAWSQLALCAEQLLRRVTRARVDDLIGILHQLGRYTFVSAAALALDVAIYAILVGAGWRAALAGAIGYAIGLALHFSLSTRFVFDASRTAKSSWRLFAEFVATGLVGIAITAAIIALATEILHLGAALAKLAAVAASFAAVYLMRRSIVFAAR